MREQSKLATLVIECHECRLTTWLKSCGTFHRLAVEKLVVKSYMCRLPVLYVLGADLEVLRRVHNGDELKLKVT